jgi:hypothetical protein
MHTCFVRTQSLRNSKVTTVRNWRINRWIAAPLVILLPGFALRLAGLNPRPLCWDEGDNVYFAHRGLLGVLRESHAMPEIDPPVYRLALGYVEVGR